MKKYYIFIWGTYYPEGGMNDLKLITDDLKEAASFLRKEAENIEYAHYNEETENFELDFNFQIWDTESEKEIALEIPKPTKKQIEKYYEIFKTK